MAKSETYSVSDFLMLLKLGIWNRGYVKDWGLIESIKVNKDGDLKNDCFIKKQPEDYLKTGCYFSKQLGTGLYLHDMHMPYSFAQDYSRICTHMMVISQCRLRGLFEEKIYYLKVTNRQSLSQFRQMVLDKFSPPERRKLWGPFERIRPKSRYDSGHLSPHRKY